MADLGSICMVFYALFLVVRLRAWQFVSSATARGIITLYI
jgi:hypothetical protein